MRCTFCGKTDAFPFLRSPIRWLSTPAGPVCSDDCGRLLIARDAEPIPSLDWLDMEWTFESFGEVAGWRVVEPWWAVGPAGHVMLELDASIGPGWWLIRRGVGRAGPFGTWQEAVVA
jgi:hypothetical protein